MRKRLNLLAAALLMTLLVGGGAAAQVLNIAIPQDPDSFDPIRTVAAATSEVAFNIYEGLVKATPEGGVEPALASHWEVDPSGTRYTFYLRDAQFHNGRPVTVEDVVHSLNRARDPHLSVRAGELDMIKGIKALENGVQIELQEPNGAFIYLLTEVYASIYPADAEDLSRRPIGTGPYYLADWRPHQHLELRRFDGHWSGRQPYFAQVNFLIIPDENSQVLNLKAGRVQLIPRLEASVLHQVANSPGIKVEMSPMNLVQLFAINNARPPFDDLRVRRALALGLNREEILLGAAWGQGVLLDSALSPAMAQFYNDQLGEVNAYDPEQARKLLQEAGQENLRFTLTLPANYPLHVQAGELAARQWEELGLQVDLEIVEWGTWLERVYTQRDYDVSIIGLAGRLDPHAILVRYTTGSSRNFFNFSNSRYDELIELGLRALGEERRAIYWEAQEILARELPGVFVMDPLQMAAMRQEIQGWRSYPVYVVDVASLYQ
ncbi:MAG TPA: ABC transporter substrate-binding protein [Limnochordia bacterium]|nr:ABC transporter substrate-binding protein [Limnochordia bacterium]